MYAFRKCRNLNEVLNLLCCVQCRVFHAVSLSILDNSLVIMYIDINKAYDRRTIPSGAPPVYRISSRFVTLTATCIVTPLHYNDVIMGAIAFQIISLVIVYSTDYSDADQRNHQSSASLAFVQMASNTENVSIWWRHHELTGIIPRQ